MNNRRLGFFYETSMAEEHKRDCLKIDSRLQMFKPTFGWDKPCANVHDCKY